MNPTATRRNTLMDIGMPHPGNRPGAWRWLLLVAGAGLVLCACDTPPPPAAMAASRPIAPVPAKSAPKVDAATTALTQAPGAAGTTAAAGDVEGEDTAGDPSACALETFAFSSPQGSFGMVACALSEDDPQAPAEFRFVHRDAKGDIDGVQYVDRDTLEATVDETEPKFWDGHIMTLDLPQERGGVLLIANWTGKHFATSAYQYMSGEEDGLQLAWHDGAFLVTTSTDGVRRLLPGDAGSAEPDVFAQESLSCEDASRDGLTQDLSLAVDTRGEVTGVSYLATTPAGDGTANSCSVDANREDGDTDWGASVNGAQLVTWKDGDVREDGSMAEPSRLSITRKDGSYTLDLQVRHSSFCGQSSALASKIVLKRGQRTCAKVEF